MEAIDRLDPELRPAITAPLFEDLNDIEAARAERVELAKRTTEPTGGTDTAGVAQEDLWIDGPAGAGALMVRMYRPAAAGVGARLPSMLWTHGGGHVMGSVAQDDPLARALVARHGCGIVSVDWRRSPEHPFPAALEDCYAALGWLVAHGTEHGLDSNRIVLGGNSSGAGTTAGLALMVRDHGEYAVRLQLLIAPMLDDTNTTPSSERITDRRFWCRTFNEIAWGMYLGDAVGSDAVSPYAAPSRASNLAGLPPAFIGVGELDLFLDEDVAYALALTAAGVQTELHVYPRASHGFHILGPTSHVAQRLLLDIDDALARAWAD